MINKWPTTKISDVSENLDSKRVPVAKLKRKSGDIPYYGATGIVDYVNDYIFDEELLLIGEDGADWSGGANTAFIINGKSWVNNHAHVLRIKNANIQFVMNYLNYSDLRNYISGTTRGKLNQASLNKIRILNPSLKIQAKVADILSAIDETIEKTDQIVQKTEKLKQGLMSELLTKGIGHKKLKKTKLGKIPDEWELNTLDQITHNITDGKHGDCKNESNSGFYFVSVKDIYDGQIHYENARQITKADFEDTHKRTRLETGDLLLTNSGTIGRMAIVQDTKKTSQTTFQKSVAIIKPDPTKASVHFLMYWLGFVLKNLELKSSGSAQKNLLLRDLRSYKIPVPLHSEQSEICQILGSVDQKILNEKSALAQVMELKKGLMQDIFSQKVEIN